MGKHRKKTKAPERIPAEFFESANEHTTDLTPRVLAFLEQNRAYAFNQTFLKGEIGGNSQLYDSMKNSPKVDVKKIGRCMYYKFSGNSKIRRNRWRGKGRMWTKPEDTVLLKLHKRGAPPLEISKYLCGLGYHRTRKAVDNRLVRLRGKGKLK